MRTFSRTTQFKKDVKLAGKRGKDLPKLKAALERLIEGAPLPAEFKDHHCAETLPAAATVISSRNGGLSTNRISMHQSLCLDCKILLPAFKKVFIREGIIAAGEAAMPEFQGIRRETKSEEISGQ